jgi:hypothetical protein
MQVVSIIVYGLFYAVLISIPVFIVFSIIRGATSAKDAAATQKEIKRLLEELIELQKETNNQIKKK